jgi:hypothetical protein
MALQTGNNMTTLKADNVVVRENGSLHIVEAMFSASCDLSTDRLEVLARLHPAKKNALDQMPPNCLIEVHVNKPGGGIKKIDYSTIRNLAPTNVIGEAHGKNFDEGAEPVLRQMRDGSFRLVFNAMPPLSHPLGANFDIDDFGEALTRCCKVKIDWEDRDVFYIDKRAGADDIRAVLGFIRDYRGRAR